MLTPTRPETATMPQDDSGRADAATLHDEWMIDEAIAETFPASDPIAVGQPGSLLSVRYGAVARQASARRGASPWWLAVAGAFIVGIVAGRRIR
jgi:hypothetical protein